MNYLEKKKNQTLDVILKNTFYSLAILLLPFVCDLQFHLIRLSAQQRAWWFFQTKVDHFKDLTRTLKSHCRLYGNVADICLTLKLALLISCLSSKNQKNTFPWARQTKEYQNVRYFCIRSMKVNNFLDSRLWFCFFNSFPFGGFCLWLLKFRLFVCWKLCCCHKK